MPAQPPAEAPMEVFAECADWLIVIGGSAVQSYGMDRMTFDCDCAILDRDEPRLRAALSRLGYVADTPQPTFSRYFHVARLRPVVDAMRTDASTFAKLIAESRWVEILGFKVRVPAPLHLVSMKLHALKQQPDRMHKDWPDICHLLDNYRGDWTPAQLKTLADRYASDELADQLSQRGYL
jgi:hypothetical protein